jgi:dTDP-4-dehydrorhamnose 3,5-epimerase
MTDKEPALVRFTPTALEGAFILDLDVGEDDRGFFARAFCAREYEERGLDSRVAQRNISFNSRCGTVRGLHYQVGPAAEPKTVRCTRGVIFDVIVDLRPGSPTYLRHIGVELSADNRRSIYVPALFAHGYQTLTDDAEVDYMVGEFYSPEHERGACYDDPAFGIDWPIGATAISEKDRNWPLFETVGR